MMMAAGTTGGEAPVATQSANTILQNVSNTDHEDDADDVTSSDENNFKLMECEQKNNKNSKEQQAAEMLELEEEEEEDDDEPINIMVEDKTITTQHQVRLRSNHIISYHIISYHVNFILTFNPDSPIK
jgi:hypothetical protein